MRESVAEHAPDSLFILEPEFISDMFPPVPNEDLHLVHQAHTPHFLHLFILSLTPYLSPPFYQPFLDNPPLPAPPRPPSLPLPTINPNTPNLLPLPWPLPILRINPLIHIGVVAHPNIRV
jgi:hypothetical protein